MSQIIDFCMELDSVALRLYKKTSEALGDENEQLWNSLMSEKRRRIEEWRTLRGGYDAALVPSPVVNPELTLSRLKGKLERLLELQEQADDIADFRQAVELAVQAESLLVDSDSLRLLKVGRIYGLSRDEETADIPAIGGITPRFAEVGEATAAFADSLVKLHEAHQRLWDREDRDPVTGAYARRVLFQHGTFLVDWAARYSKPLGLLHLQIDQFSSIIGQFGHAAADGLLSAAYNRVNAVTRRTDWVVRNGADDFIVLILGTSEEGMETVAEKILAQLSSPSFHVDRFDIPVTASIGLCLYPSEIEGEPTVELLLHLADKALEAARAAGGNCLFVAGADMVPTP